VPASRKTTICDEVERVVLNQKWFGSRKRPASPDGGVSLIRTGCGKKAGMRMGRSTRGDHKTTSYRSLPSARSTLEMRWLFCRSAVFQA
jgi:hypothetical protein